MIAAVAVAEKLHLNEESVLGICTFFLDIYPKLIISTLMFLNIKTTHLYLIQ